MNLFQRYAELKQKVGGNREKREFEFTFGATVQEKNGITPPSAPIRRILSELDFALKLSRSRSGRWDDEIAGALALLEACMDEEGVLTRRACAAAEEKLLVMADAAKEYEVLYVAHAHIDMNWMWGWQETVAVALSTFRTMLNLMKEYPGFTFSQSQASVYRIVEEYDPDMMDEIRARIREGRWEVTANAWVETDKNMPDTESLIRHIEVTRNYLREVWGVENVQVDFSPDTFGHSRFVPEINTFGSVPYYYHCRGLQDDLTLYRYRAPSGSEVLMYKEPYWYNSGVCPDNGTGAIEMERRCGGLKTSLIVYGVGDHGGGPSRRDVETVLEMQSWPVFPTLRFGTLHEYFRKAEAVREKLPVVDHELNAIFTGCYSTQSRIKLANRRAEAALLDSERMSAMAGRVLGAKSPADRFESAWQKVLFTHFHDILTGSCVQESREYAMGQLAQAIATAQTEQAKACEKLSQAVDTSMFPEDGCIRFTQSEGAGAGHGIASYAGVPNPERGAGKVRIYTIFNASAQARRELAELTVWDYPGNLDAIEVVDDRGEPMPFQMLDREQVRYWDHRFVRLLVKCSVPPMGYATCAIREKPLTDYPTHLLYAEREEQPNDPVVLENSRLKARFDTGSGMLRSLVDKSTGEELLAGPAGLYLVRTEDSDTSAWRIGRYLGMEPVTGTSRVRVQDGGLRKKVIFDQKVMNSTVFMTVSLDEDDDVLRYGLEVDWHESCKAQPWIPLLSFRLPLKKHSDSILTDVPAGFAARPAREMDVPALSFGCAAAEGATAALITDCKYGFRLAEDTLSVTLINTAGTPDPYPERGVHNIQLFVALTDGDAATLKRRAEALIRPLTAVPTARHEGKLPPVGSMMKVEAAHTLLSSVQNTRDGALTVRLFEGVGEPETVRLTVPFRPARAVLTNLNGEALGEAAVSGDQVAVEAKPWSIVQVKIYE